MSQKSKKLKNEMESLRDTWYDLNDDHKRLQSEYLRLRQQNEALGDSIGAATGQSDLGSNSG